MTKITALAQAKLALTKLRFSNVLKQMINSMNENPVKNPTLNSAWNKKLNAITSSSATGC